jgi:hypothetical protein
MRINPIGFGMIIAWILILEVSPRLSATGCSVPWPAAGIVYLFSGDMRASAGAGLIDSVVKIGL